MMAIAPQIIDLHRLTPPNAALLFLRTLPIHLQRKARPWGFKLNCAFDDVKMAKALAESETIKATNNIPGVIVQVAQEQIFQYPDKIFQTWDRDSLIKGIKIKAFSCRPKFDEIKKYMKEHIKKNRDEVVA